VTLTASGRAHIAWAAPVALAIIIVSVCALAAGSWRVYSDTWDEPEHLAAGVELLDRGKYEYDTEHPPLARLFLAFGPFLAGARSFGTPPPDGRREGVDILYDGDHYWRTLTLARLGTLPFLALLLFTTWLWGRRLLRSQAAALLAVLLLASVPPVLGHGALASLDVPAAATILLALYTLQHWLVTGRWRDALWFGLSAGIATTTKFSAIPFLGLALVALALVHVALALRAARAGPPAGPPAVPRPPLWRAWAAGAAIAALAALVPVWLMYGPRVPDPAGVALRFNWALSYLLASHGVGHVFGVVLSHLSLPRELKDLVNGIVAVKAHNDSGHLSFLLGEVRRDGWWYFYLVALAVKTPLPLLVAAPFGLAWLARDGWGRSDAWSLAPLVLVVTLLVFASSFSRINIGIRHILILYPFLALGGVCTLERLRGAIARVRNPRVAQAATAVLLALLAWQLSTLWSAFPDYLPYFNEAVAHPERVLVDSDLDWGQDLHRLELRAAALQIQHLSLAYRGTVRLSRESLPPVTLLPPRQPTRGWVAVSELARTRKAGDYAWLDAYQPVERVGKTIDLYYIP
jgi:hypothetical protein